MEIESSDLTISASQYTLSVSVYLHLFSILDIECPLNVCARKASSLLLLLRVDGSFRRCGLVGGI